MSRRSSMSWMKKQEPKIGITLYKKSRRHLMTRPRLQMQNRRLKPSNKERRIQQTS